MRTQNDLRRRLARSYWVWRLYHSLIADAVAIQRPTKFKVVYEFLGTDLGVVADIGCGPGVFTRYLCAHARQVVAADIDEESLSRTRARHQERRNLGSVVTTAGHLPFRDGRLNTVLFLEVLEHLTDDEAALREIYRVLAPGGRVILSVPVPPGEVNQGEPWGHKREGYELEEIAALLERNGFGVERHGFAVFKFSRLSEQLIRSWRKLLRLPAPIFLSWVSYLDRLVDGDARQKGQYIPATVIILATKNIGQISLQEKH